MRVFLAGLPQQRVREFPETRFGSDSDVAGYSGSSASARATSVRSWPDTSGGVNTSV